MQTFIASWHLIFKEKENTPYLSQEYVLIVFCDNCSMPNKSMALKFELVLIVYKQESEEIIVQHRD